MIWNDNIKQCLLEIRPMGKDEVAKMKTYCEEAISEWVIPQLTPKFVKALNDNSEDYEDVFNGGWYDEDNEYFEGLNKALAYLSYSRMVRNRDITVTASGIRMKEQELSEGANYNDIVRIANESEKIGFKYLLGVRKYCVFTGYLTKDYKSDRLIKSSIKIIGD